MQILNVKLHVFITIDKLYDCIDAILLLDQNK